MVAEGVALRETCTGEATKECQDSEGGGSESYLPTCGKSETEGDCGANAYRRIYCDATRTENESDDYDGPSPCAE